MKIKDPNPAVYWTSVNNKYQKHLLKDLKFPRKNYNTIHKRTLYITFCEEILEYHDNKSDKCLDQIKILLRQGLLIHHSKDINVGLTALWLQNPKIFLILKRGMGKEFRMFLKSLCKEPSINKETKVTIGYYFLKEKLDVNKWNVKRTSCDEIYIVKQ